MTALSNLTMIRCDGPGGFASGCPDGAFELGARTADDLRDQLAGQGWQVGIPVFDLPDADRCPRCGEGLA